MGSQLKKGDTAPDFTFNTPWKEGGNFYNECGDKTAVLVFLRYHGCPVCQMELAEFKREIARFEDKKAKVFIVIQSDPAHIASLTNREDWPFTIICDPDSDIYDSYHVAPGGIIKYMHPAGLAAAIKATFKGFRHGKFEGRETQLPEAFIISPDKNIIFSHYGKTIPDIPSPTILAARIN